MRCCRPDTRRQCSEYNRGRAQSKIGKCSWQPGRNRPDTKCRRASHCRRDTQRTGQTTAGIEVVAGDAGKTGGIVTGGAGRVSTLQARRVGVEVVTGQTGVASSSVGTAQTAESGVALKAGTTDQVVPRQTGKALGGRQTRGTGTQRARPARLVVAIDTGETCAR